MIVIPTSKIGSPVQTHDIKTVGWWWKSLMIPIPVLDGLYSPEECQEWVNWIQNNWEWLHTYDIIILAVGNSEIIHYRTKKSDKFCGNSVLLDLKFLKKDRMNKN